MKSSLYNILDGASTVPMEPKCDQGERYKRNVYKLPVVDEKPSPTAEAAEPGR